MAASLIGAAITGGLGYLASRNASRSAERQAEGANALAEEQARLAREQWQTWLNDYRPMEQAMLQEAQNYDTPARREAARAMAIGDVNRQFGLQRESVGARLSSFGVDPSRAKYAGTFARLGGAQGAAAAGAAGVADRAIEEGGWGRRFAMAGLGRNLMSNAAGGLSSAAATMSGLSAASSNRAQAAAWGAGQFAAPWINQLSTGIANYLRPSTTIPGYVPTGSLASTGVDPYGINGG